MYVFMFLSRAILYLKARDEKNFKLETEVS
jgi:hypothetical protein